MTAQKKAAGVQRTPTAAIVQSARHSTGKDPIAAFRAAMLSAGIEPPAEIIPDGVIHRFNASGKRGSMSGWYVLHLDAPAAGVFGDWRTGITQNWCAGGQGKLSPAERAAIRERIDRLQAAREVEAQVRHEDAAQAAAVRWAAALPVIGQGHPYLKAKAVQAHGLRVEGGGHTLLVPMRDAGGTLWGLQSIYPDGGKRFMPGQRVRGCYHVIGEIGAGEATQPMAICEGYATGATIHETTGLPVAVAFNAGNLIHVTLALRDAFPRVLQVVCADDDWKTPGNPGLTKAGEAATVLGARLAVPDFTGLPRGDGDTDFNDVARLEKLDKLAGDTPERGAA